MKKLIFMLAAVLVIATISGCSAADKKPISTEDAAKTAVDDKSLLIEDTEDTFETLTDEIDDEEPLSSVTEGYEVTIIEDTGTGEPIDYKDLRDGYLCYYKNLSFISYEIISVYSAEEAFELTGEGAFTRRTTLYNVHVYYDHLLGEEVDYNLNIAHVGNMSEQLLGFPMYESGMKFMSCVFGESDTWRVPVGELEFLLVEENGKSMACHIGNDSFVICEDDPLIDIKLPDDETKTYFSALNNPMRFTSKSEEFALGDFIREDWLSAGIISKIGDETK